MRVHIKRIIHFCVAIFVATLVFSFCRPVFSQALYQQVANELEYVDGLVQAGIAGDREKLAEAHRTMTNLSVTLKQVADNRRRALFMLAIGYNYVEMCPSVFFFQLYEKDNPTGFAIKCAEESIDYMTGAAKIAEEKLDQGAAADAIFLAGIGVDRLKSNLSDIPGTDTELYFEMARDMVRKAADLGPSFDGIETILGRYSKPEYRTEPVLDDNRFKDIQRLLVLQEAFMPPESARKVEVPAEYSNSSSSAPASVDDDTYTDYRWRFTIKKPDDEWKFSTQTAEDYLHLTIQETAISGRQGSGLNVICRTLTPSEENASVSDIVDKSITLLQQAGYKIETAQDMTLAGAPAYEIISTHEYNALIPSESMGGSDSNALVSKQYMMIAVQNGIQYVLSFSTLKPEYSRVFPVFHGIARTVQFF